MDVGRNPARSPPEAVREGPGAAQGSRRVPDEGRVGGGAVRGQGVLPAGPGLELLRAQRGPGGAQAADARRGGGLRVPGVRGRVGGTPPGEPAGQGHQAAVQRTAPRRQDVPVPRGDGARAIPRRLRDPQPRRRAIRRRAHLRPVHQRPCAAQCRDAHAARVPVPHLRARHQGGRSGQPPLPAVPAAFDRAVHRAVREPRGQGALPTRRRPVPALPRLQAQRHDARAAVGDGEGRAGAALRGRCGAA